MRGKNNFILYLLAKNNVFVLYLLAKSIIFALVNSYRKGTKL